MTPGSSVRTLLSVTPEAVARLLSVMVKNAVAQVSLTPAGDGCGQKTFVTARLTLKIKDVGGLNIRSQHDSRLTDPDGISVKWRRRRVQTHQLFGFRHVAPSGRRLDENIRRPLINLAITIVDGGLVLTIGYHSIPIDRNEIP